MDARLQPDKGDSERAAYRTAYDMGGKIASRVDVMRWELEFYYRQFCRSEIWQNLTPPEAQHFKLGFIDGFAAAQNRKALTAQVLMRGASVPPRITLMDQN